MDAANHVDCGVGGGVFPDMKKSRDFEITGRADWNDVSATLMGAVLKALMAYLRQYPYTIVAPLMLEHRPADGGPARRLGADDLVAMDDAGLLALVQQLLRPGSINLQRYTAGEGGYPYWHCELYPRDANAETLHRTLLCLHLGVEVDGVQLKQQLTFDHHIADVDMNAQHPAWYATADALPLPHIKLTGATQGRCQ